MTFKITKEIFEKDIDEFNFSTRTSNGLKRSGFKKIKDILNNQNELYKIKGLGIKSIKEIKNTILNAQIEMLLKEEEGK